MNMANMESSQQDMLRRKQEHFGSFKSMLNDEESTSDPGRQASLDAVKAKAFKRHRQPGDSGSNGLVRSASDTNIAKKDRQLAVDVELDQRPPSSSAGAARLPASFITGHTYSGSPNKPTGTNTTKTTASPSETTRKRKRGETDVVRLVPEEHRIFKGLIFYFFPNTDTNPARKMRIAKAREFGAVWQKNYDVSVTHIIVDRTVDFASLMKFLKLDALPSNTIVVSEGWPAECISFQMIMDPKHPQFKVKGYEPTKATLQNRSDSDLSLQLKPAGKAVMARQLETQLPSKTAAASPPSQDDSSDDNDDGLEMAAIQPLLKPTVGNPDYSTEFDQAVREAREVQHLPLEDEDGESCPSSSSGPLQAPQSPSSLQSPNKKGKLGLEDNFQCMKPSNRSNGDGPNASTIAILDEMAHYYDRIGDGWRTRAYRKAISTLRGHAVKVCTKERALALPQIGERLATKIEEIAVTNRLRRLDNTKTDINDQIFQTFMGIYGAGPVLAGKWVDAGYTTLDEVVAKADLNTNQKIGIEHYEDFNSRIPRVEVEKLGAIVRKNLIKLDANFEVIVGGSYRRGAATSGDLDCIITHKEENTPADYIRQVVLDRLVPKLKAKNFLTADLAVTSRDDGSKWHGACHLPSNTNEPSKAPWRRIDLLLVPPAELGAALIYFTGNDLFNRSMRLLASKKGFRLNQRGLYRDVMRGKQRERLTEGTVVESRDERKIFEVLGVPWREAHERNC